MFDSISFLAQGPLMITGPGMNTFPTGAAFGAGTYPPYGAAPGFPSY